MYDVIGEKIKGLATAVFIIEALATVIVGIALMVIEGELIFSGLLTIILGPVVAWASSLLLYGFGELIDKVCEIAINTRNTQNASASPNSEKVATTFKSAGAMVIPKRIK